MTASAGQSSVRIVEVGPRDGLQNIKTSIPTSTKIQLISKLEDCGLKTIELTSAVSKKAVPQLGDCQELLASIPVRELLNTRRSTHRFPVLVPNIKGLEVALAHKVGEVAVFISATEGFSKANINCTVKQGLERAREVITRARSQHVAVRGYVSCIFADPYEGPTQPSAVLSVVAGLLDAGCYEVSLGDTTGVGNARSVRDLLICLFEAGIPVQKLAGHFHDTYGQALANVWEAYNCGLRVFDSSVAGLGGCPFAPGARGNVATEDLVYMFDGAGISTGVNLIRLAEVGVWISNQLGQVNGSRAGSALASKQKLSEVPTRKPASSIAWQLLGDFQSDIIKYRSGKNLKIVLNRPKNGNALTKAMIQGLTTVFEDARSDSSISRIILTANGKFFCTGMDLAKGSSNVAQQDSARADEQYQLLTRLFEVIDQSPQVTIACLTGHAFGGGVGLAFACDVRLAVGTANVTLSEVKLGLCPATISKYVIREWGHAFAREAMLSARPISAKELLSRGIVSKLVQTQDEMPAMLDAYLQNLRVTAPKASSMCKQLIQLAYVDSGGQQQADGIKKLFDDMMRADGESAFALARFQTGQKTVDWDAKEVGADGSKTRAKL